MRAVNYYLFNGEQIVRSEMLQVEDPVELGVFVEKEKGKFTERLRDLIKQATILSDGKYRYLLLGLENQDKVHTAMPVKNLIMDALRYAEQVSERKKERKANKEYGDSSEFLSGFGKEDKLKPVITLVIYFGPDEWDAPVSLHEMMQTDNRELLQQVENYKIRLIAPQQLTSEDFQKFQTTLGPVLQFIKHSKEKEKLELLLQDETFQKIDYTAAMVINSCTQAKFTFEKSEGVVNMCKALDDIREECREEGRTSARIEERKKFAVNLLQSNMPVEFVAKMIPDFPLETILQLKQELQNV